MDKDGDLDVLMTHGDMFDDPILKPYHGIQWLENRGTLPFVEHTLATWPASHRAQAADLDGDGDLDIVGLRAGSSEATGDGGTARAGVAGAGEAGQLRAHTLEKGLPHARHAGRG